MPTGTGSRGPAPLVLVCDDTEQIRRLIRINLELEGYEVEEAGDGQEAMTRLVDPIRRGPGHLLDAQMAPYDGWWAIAEIRSTRAGPVPVVLVTAVVTHDALEASAPASTRSSPNPSTPTARRRRLTARGRRQGLAGALDLRG